MQTPQLLNDIINVLLLLAPAAAVICLVLGGISLRREGGGITFVLGGGFSKWMFWCVVFLTLQPLLTWFSSFGVGVPLPGGGINASPRRVRSQSNYLLCYLIDTTKVALKSTYLACFQ
ncbi:MAG TPA: hypothetical protein VMX16_15250 [Terriglobia bacterium]|nr:hypothetical protein [Terriglobia bacterium]